MSTLQVLSYWVGGAHVWIKGHSCHFRVWRVTHEWLSNLPVGKVSSALKSQREIGKVTGDYPVLDRSRPQYQGAQSSGQQREGGLFTAPPFVLWSSSLISGFTLTPQVCVLMTLLPSGSPYFPKDINHPAWLPTLSFKCHHSQKEKMLSRPGFSCSDCPGTTLLQYL